MFSVNATSVWNGSNASSANFFRISNKFHCCQHGNNGNTNILNWKLNFTLKLYFFSFAIYFVITFVLDFLILFSFHLKADWKTLSAVNQSNLKRVWNFFQFIRQKNKQSNQLLKVRSWTRRMKEIIYFSFFTDTIIPNRKVNQHVFYGNRQIH